ncbi:ADP-ribosylation factor H-like isoform X3 [Liolophura sinensis]|uniref:ADP-ribosylation factor H-like isoform X3 n=1 Tax=Liolophura sinensis TaxID=3198878 RepID=UPI003158BB0F
MFIAFMCVINRYRLEEAKHELLETLKDERLTECPVLILAHKQDLTMAMKPDKLTKELGLGYIKQKWAIFPSSAMESLKGILNAFEWLSDALESRDLKQIVVKPVVETADDVYTHRSLEPEELYQNFCSFHK